MSPALDEALRKLSDACSNYNVSMFRVLGNPVTREVEATSRPAGIRGGSNDPLLPPDSVSTVAAQPTSLIDLKREPACGPTAPMTPSSTHDEEPASQAKAPQGADARSELQTDELVRSKRDELQASQASEQRTGWRRLAAAAGSLLSRYMPW